MHGVLVLKRNRQNADEDKIRSMFSHMTVMVDDHFSTIRKRLHENSYPYAVFMTYNPSFPTSWRLDEIKMDGPLIALTQVNQIDLILMRSFLDSIGMFPRKYRSALKTNNDVPELVHRSLTFIDQHLQENELSLEMVASNMYISRCHFSRLFKEYLGIGFKEYVMGKRMEMAKEMLKEGESVTDVCYAVGYGDLTHFGRVFKRLVGERPSDFRRKWRNKGSNAVETG